MIYLAVAIILIIIGFWGAASIGIFILPIGLVMILGVVFWGRPWIVAALVSAAVAFSVAYMGTAPLYCGTSSVKESGRPVVTRERCTRLFLPDIEGRSSSRASDRVLALGIAAVVACTAGLAGAGIGRALSSRKQSAA